MIVFVCPQVGERYPAPTQNRRAPGGNLHLPRLAWIMGRLPGANPAGTVGAGVKAIRRAMAGATRQ